MRSYQVTLSYSEATINPMHEFVGECKAVKRDRLLHGTLTDDGRDTFLFYVEGDREAYLDAIEAYDAIRAYEVTAIDDESFYIYLEQENPEIDQAIFAAFSRSGVIVVPPVDFGDSGIARLTMLGDPDQVQAVLADLPAGIGTEITRIGEYEGGPPGVLSSLTERQLEAITAGVEVGYYAIPREGSAADVGRQLGCASGTAAEHLQKAESRIITELVDRREGQTSPEA